MPCELVIYEQLYPNRLYKGCFGRDPKTTADNSNTAHTDEKFIKLFHNILVGLVNLHNSNPSLESKRFFPLAQQGVSESCSFSVREPEHQRF